MMTRFEVRVRFSAKAYGVPDDNASWQPCAHGSFSTIARAMLHAIRHMRQTLRAVGKDVLCTGITCTQYAKYQAAIEQCLREQELTIEQCRIFKSL